MNLIINAANSVFPIHPAIPQVAPGTKDSGPSAAEGSVAPIQQSPSSGSFGPIQDTVELSGHVDHVLPAEVMEHVSARLARTNAIRAEIEAGTYETPERIAGTVERLLDILA